jgi:hypothetical protein
VANKVMFKVKLATITLFLKPLPIKVHGFDTFFSSCMNATMMCVFDCLPLVVNLLHGEGNGLNFIMNGNLNP